MSEPKIRDFLENFEVQVSAGLELLPTEFSIPEKWQQRISDLGEVEFATPEFKTLLDGWFGQRNGKLRTSIEHASAIVYYRHQSSVPVVRTLVCDDAGQFKLLTDKLALYWIHEGRHYEKVLEFPSAFAVLRG